MGVENANSQATSPDADKPGRAQPAKLSVFISYSRDDLDFADELEAALRACGFGTSLDRHSISGGEEWKRRLESLIRQADTIVFILSPSSTTSSTCSWEVETAAGLGKRIVPILCRPLDNAVAPQRLQDLNYIFFYKEAKAPDSGFGRGLAQLVDALNTDLDWLREHTRLLLRATEWDAGGRAQNRLLSGGDIPAAKTWALSQPKGAPEPTVLQREFIRASEEAEDARLLDQRRRLEEIDTAQKERERALHLAEEALGRTIRLQRRQAWAAALTVAILALIGWWAYGIVSEQRAVAREAAREDIRGQIVAYAAAFGSEEKDIAEGELTSPYTTPLVQKLREKKNLVEAIVDAHQQVLDTSEGTQRPLLSTSMNGQIYLFRQPQSRRKRVLAIAVDDPGAGIEKLQGPPHDVHAFISTLTDLGFSQSDITVLQNPDRRTIEETIARIAQSLHKTASQEGHDGRLKLVPDPLVRVGLYREPVAPLASPDNTLFVFFYSGHGVHVGGADYIIPRLAADTLGINGPDDIRKSAMSVNALAQAVERAASASVVILDTHFPKISFDPMR
jgi:hypothetical protein